MDADSRSQEKVYGQQVKTKTRRIPENLNELASSPFQAVLPFQAASANDVSGSNRTPLFHNRPLPLPYPRSCYP
jgi:hypothetical protein